MVHEVDGEDRVHDKGHDEGGSQGKDEHGGEVDHELPDDARPEQQREEGGEGGQGSREYGYEDLTCRHHCRAGRIDAALALGKDAVGVLDDHDSVVHDDPQAEEQGEEDDEVQGYRRPNDGARCREEDEGQEHTQRNGKGHEEGVGHAHEEHEDDEHQDEANNNGVDEVVEGGAGQVTLVAGDDNLQIAREAGFHILDGMFYIVGGLDEVFAAVFDDVEGYDVLAAETGVAFPVLNGIFYRSDILKVYGGSVVGAADDDLFDILRGVELSFQLQVAFHIADVQLSAGDVEILSF